MNSLLLTAGSFSDAHQRFWIGKPGNSTYAADVESAYMFIVWVSIISFAVLMGVMFYFVARYRARPGLAPERSPAHNTALEVTWSVAPMIILVIIFFWGFRGYMKVQLAPSDAEEIVMRGQKWNWSATYVNGAQSQESVRLSASPEHRGVVDVPVFVVPAGRPIRLRMTSADVIHAFWIPDFRMKMDVIPNRFTSLNFEAMREGEEHEVFCAEYCGDYHSEMAALIRVLPPAEYEQKLREWADFISKLPPVERGQAIWKQKCATCHTVDGGKNTGPSWKDVFGEEQELSDGARVVADENYIRESIYEPAKKIVKGYQNQMPTFQGQINDKELEGIIAYMKSISKHAPAAAPAPQPAAGAAGAGEKKDEQKKNP
ncbi:MAG: cytochrome c oxidase subunit II [Phycisphaerae bacterium]|nr:cytochrome c oxidase subunit II [Phycisphaerae bacterium]